MLPAWRWCFRCLHTGICEQHPSFDDCSSKKALCGTARNELRGVLGPSRRIFFRETTVRYFEISRSDLLHPSIMLPSGRSPLIWPGMTHTPGGGTRWGSMMGAIGNGPYLVPCPIFPECPANAVAVHQAQLRVLATPTGVLALGNLKIWLRKADKPLKSTPTGIRDMRHPCRIPGRRNGGDRYELSRQRAAQMPDRSNRQTRGQSSALMQMRQFALQSISLHWASPGEKEATQCSLH